MKVKAIALGYYDHVRRRPGDVFEMEDGIYQHTPKDKEGNPVMKDGKPVVKTCSWVVSVDKSAPLAKAKVKAKGDKQVPLSKYQQANAE